MKLRIIIGRILNNAEYKYVLFIFRSAKVISRLEIMNSIKSMMCYFDCYCEPCLIWCLPTQNKNVCFDLCTIESQMFQYMIKSLSVNIISMLLDLKWKIWSLYGININIETFSITLSYQCKTHIYHNSIVVLP